MATPTTNVPAMEMRYHVRINSGIYCISVDRSSSGKSSKFYIGQAIRLHKRKDLHWAALRRGDHGNPILQRAWNKYGESAFLFSVLMTASPYNLTFLEQKFLDDHIAVYGGHAVFNLRKKAVNSQLGLRHSQDVRRRLSEKQRQNWQNETYRTEISAALKIARERPEVRERLSLSQKEVQNRPEILEANRQRAIDFGKNPIVSARRKATNARPEIKAKRSASAKKALASPAIRKAMSDTQKIVQNRPEVKAKIAAKNALSEIKTKRSIASSLAQSTLEARQKQRKAQLIAQNRPDVKIKKSEAVRKALADPESIARRKATNARPEVRLRRSEAAKAWRIKKAETNADN